jgi:hypothetical protein
MTAAMSGQTTRGAGYTVLVNSCDSFEDCWQPFFLLLRRYWPECDAPLLLVTETKEWHHEGLGIRCSKVQRAGEGRLTWSECLIRSLDQLDTPLVLYFQDDYFLHRPVRADIVERAVMHMLAHPEVKHPWPLSPDRTRLAASHQARRTLPHLDASRPLEGRCAALLSAQRGERMDVRDLRHLAGCQAERDVPLRRA